MRMRETDAMLGNASPRKPSVRTASRSSMVPILLVAWRASARTNSSAAMPTPSSRTRHNSAPPFSISISIALAPGIEAVLDQFLDHGGRAFDHLAGRDLVYQLLRQNPDRHGRAAGPRGRGREDSKAAGLSVPRVSYSAGPRAPSRRAATQRREPRAGHRIFVPVVADARTDRFGDALLVVRVAQSAFVGRSSR